MVYKLPEHVEVIAAMSSAEAAELSVKAVRNGEADVLMKGTSQQRIF